MIPEVGETWEIGDDDQQIRIVTFVSQDEKYFHALDHRRLRVYKHFHPIGEVMPLGWRKVSS